MVSYMVHYDILLQNATDVIAKYERCVIIKCNRSLLQNAAGITKCGVYRKIRWYIPQ